METKFETLQINARNISQAKEPSYGRLQKEKREHWIFSPPPPHHHHHGLTFYMILTLTGTGQKVVGMWS